METIKSTTILVEQTMKRKQKPQEEQLGFGQYYTDHMFRMDYNSAEGWCDARIIPYQPIMLDPAAKVFHYGQTVFEGLKAFRTADRRVLLFRPKEHIHRLNQSSKRMFMPPLDEELVLEALKQLIRLDQEWIPTAAGTALYVRPFIIATEPVLGTAASLNYTFMIILSPVGAYYSEGIDPVAIHVETEYVRAVSGGVGMVKTAGNYAASLKAQQAASHAGYAQVLWLDALHHTYIEEVGSMNVFFVIHNRVLTPMLNGSILAGITRASVLQLLGQWGIQVEQRQISMDEIAEAERNGSLQEAFGTGTAAVISPIGELNWRNERLMIGRGRGQGLEQGQRQEQDHTKRRGLTGELTRRIYDTLTQIQRGEEQDLFGWMLEIENPLPCR